MNSVRTSTEIENIKKEQIRTEETITEMKNTLEGISSRLEDAEEQISNLEDRLAEITQLKQQKEKETKKLKIV